MFTGIVEELGTVTDVTDVADGALIAVDAALVASDAAVGTSIAVNGVCLTVTEVTAGGFVADVMAETLHRSTLGQLRTGTPVNTERALTPTTRLGGHIVQGHVDGVAVLRQRESGPTFDRLSFQLPNRLARFVAEKGSIALDGVSLTVIAVTDPPQHDSDSAPAGHNEARVHDESRAAVVDVGIIPTTLRHTTLGALRPGASVNVETDIIAKHVERLLADRLPGSTAQERYR